MRNLLPSYSFHAGLVLLLVLGLGRSLSLAQDADAIIKAGDVYFENEDYFRASNFYLKALEREPNNISAKYKLADSYRLITNYETAENFYGEVLQRSESYFPLARYYLGLTQKFNGKYQEALTNLELFIKNVERKQYTRLRGAASITFSEQARIELEGCLMALEEMRENRLNHNFHLIGAPVNSVFNDYAAYTYHHDSSILITSARLESKGSGFDNRFGESLTDLFRFQYKDGAWSAIGTNDRFDKEVNSKYHDGSGVFSLDFNQFYFTHCAPNEGCKIYLTERDGEEWTDPMPLNTNINKRDSDSMHPALTSGGDTLFFASDRPGGLGGFDIWMSVAVAKNSWKPAVNLGDYINTAFREVSPFYDHIGNTLFFASDGHIGHGGLDILMAENIFDESSPVFNMGLPFNSSSDDAFFTLGEIGGYLSSNRQGGLGNFDIYSFQIDSDSEIITEIIASKKEASRNSIFVTDYAFDNPDIEMVEGLVSNLLASRLHKTNLPFSVNEQAFYDNLSEADKIRIERIVSSRMMSTQLANLQTVRHEDEFFYQQVAGDFKYYVDRMVTYYLEDFEMTNIAIIPEEDKQFYEDLNSNSKGSIDRYIALKLNEYEDIDLNDEYYSNLSSNDQERIDDISKDYLKLKTNLNDLDLSADNTGFLSALSEEDRTRTELAIANQVASVTTLEDFELIDSDKEFFNNLTGAEKNTLDNMAQAYLASSVHNLSDFLNPEDLAYFNSLKPTQKAAFDKLLAKRIQNFLKADNYKLDALNSQELEEVFSLQLSENRSMEEFLADSSLQENSILKVMAKEDQERFSRLLSSAANLVMMNSENNIKAAAIEFDRKTKIIQLIGTTITDDKNQTLSSVQFYNGLNKEEQNLFQELSAIGILDATISTEVDSISIENEGVAQRFRNRVQFELNSGGSSLPSSMAALIAGLGDNEREQFTNNIFEFSKTLNSDNSIAIEKIKSQNNLDTNTLTSLKSTPSVLSDHTSSLSDLNLGPATNNVTSTTELGSGAQASSKELSNEKVSRISGMVNSIKREFGQLLTPEELTVYTSLRPVDKRFIDQALISEFQKYVLNNDPLLDHNFSAQSESELVSSFESRFELSNFANNPNLKRLYAGIQVKSPDEKAMLVEVLVNSAKNILKTNQEELKQMTGKLAPIVSQNNLSPQPTEISEIKTIVVQAKPNLIKSLTASELQSYMRLEPTEKQMVDNLITDELQLMVDSNDPMLDYSSSNPDSRSIYDNQLKNKFSASQPNTSSSLAPDIFGKLLTHMTTAVLVNNGPELREMVLTTKPSTPLSSINSIFSPNQLKIYNGMSSEEQSLINNLINKDLNPSNSKIASGTRTGQVITIQIMDNEESIDLTNVEGELKLVGPNQFKAGETLKLVWSEAQQTWYEIARSQE